MEDLTSSEGEGIRGSGSSSFRWSLAALEGPSVVVGAWGFTPMVGGEEGKE